MEETEEAAEMEEVAAASGISSVEDHGTRRYLVGMCDGAREKVDVDKDFHEGVSVVRGTGE